MFKIQASYLHNCHTYFCLSFISDQFINLLYSVMREIIIHENTRII